MGIQWLPLDPSWRVKDWRHDGHRMSRIAIAVSRLALAACVAAFALGGVASAQTTYYWTGGSGTWSNSALWSTTLSATTPANAVPDLTTDVVAPMTTATSTAITFTLTENASARSLSFLPSFTQSGSFAAASPVTFTLGAGGIFKPAGTFNTAANVSFLLADSQAWRFGGATTINGGISNATGTSQTLLVTGTGAGPAISLNGVISDGGSGGSLGLAFVSSGTFNLSAANTYTGLTTFQDNSYVNLAFNSTSPVAPATNILASTGTLAFAGAGRLNITGSASRTSSQTVAATNLLRGGYGQLSGVPGASGTAVLNLGALTSTGGVLRLGNEFAPATSSIVTVAGPDRVLPFANFASGSFAAVVSGTLRPATLTSGTFGLTTFSSTDNYIILSSGTLATSATANVLQVGVSSQIASYTLGLGANDLTVNAIRGLNNNAAGFYNFNATTGRLRIGDSGRLILGNQPGGLGSMTFSAPISDSGATPGQLVLEPNTYNYGYGGITLSGSNTHSGGTVVTGNLGRFFIGHANALGTGTFTVGGNGIYLYASTNNLTIAGNPQVWNSDFGFDGTNALNTGNGQVSLGDTATASGRRLVTVASTGEFRVTGSIVNGSDAVFPVTGLEKAGTGMLALSGSNAYTGPTRVTAGELRFANRLAMYGGGTAAWTAANLTTTVGGNLVVNVGGAGEFTTSDLDLLATLGTSTAGFQSGFLGIDTTNVSSGTFTYASSLTNPNGGANQFGLSKYGTGTLVLSGSNTFTGGVRAVGGQLILAGTASIGSGTGAVVGGILDLGGGTFTNMFNFTSGTLTNGSLPVANLGTSGSVTITAPGVVAANLTGSGSFTKLGSGTLALRGASTFTGRTRHDAGVLIFDSIANVGSTSPNAFGLPTLASSTIGVANATLIYDGVGHTSDRVLDLTGNGNVTLNASGVGTLKLTSPMTISGTGARTITLTGSGAGQIGAIPNAANNTVVSLIKSGNGSWTLTGSNTLTGTGNVRLDGGGPLIIAHPNPFSALTGTVNFNTLSPGGELALGPIASATIAAPILMTSGRLSAGGGALVLSGTMTTNYGASGPAIVANTLQAGQISIGTLVTTANQSLKLYGNGNLDIGPISGTFFVTGTSTANGGFVIARGGTTRMTGNNTFVGVTNISGGGGTLVLDYTVNNGSKLDDGSALALNAGTYGIARSGGDIILDGTPGAAGGEEVVSRLYGSLGALSGAWNLGRASGAGVLNVGAMATGAGLTMDYTSTLNILGGGILKTTGTNVNGLLGRKAFVNGTDFATVDGSGFVQAYTGYTTLDLAANTSANTTTTYSLTGGGRNTAAKAGWALKIQNSGASDILDLNGIGLGLNSRAVILYAGGGDGKYTISGSGSLNEGTFTSGVYVAENSELTLANSTYSPGQNTWVKAGRGTVVLAFTDLLASNASLEGVIIGEGVARFANSNYFAGPYAVASSAYGTAVEFAPASGLPGITSGTGAGWTVGGGGIAEGGALRSRFGENAVQGRITIQGLGARINADADRFTLSGNIVTRGGAEVANEPGQVGNVTFGGAGTILVNGENNAGVGISGAGGVLKDGQGTLIVTATSTYTGTTAVTGGELVWGTRHAFYNANTTRWNPFSFTTGSGAAMSFRVGDAAGAFTDADIATLAQQGGETSGFMSGSYIGLDTSGASSGSYAYAGSITDTRGGLGILGVAKSGSGTLTLTGAANTFTGGVLVRGGRLLLTGVDQIGTGVAVADGGLLDVNNQPITNLFAIRSGTIANATFEVSRLTADLNGSGLVSATLTGTGGLVKTGSGTLALSAANSFTGPTTLSQGLLSIASDANLNGTSSALVFAGGGLQVTGTDLTGLNPGRTTTFTSGATVFFDVDDPRNSFAVSQVLNQGTGGLVKSGSGTLVLSTANTYSGATTISAGVLLLDDAGSLPGGIGASGGSSALVLAGGVVGLANGDFTRALGSGTDQVLFASGSGGGGFAAYGSDRMVNLGGAAAEITWNSGSTGFGSQPLVLGASTATHTVRLVNPLALGIDARTVRVDDGSADVDGELSGVLSGSGGIVKTGAGKLVLSASNTYLGTTTVSAGVLRLGNALAIGGTANAITVNGGVLDLTDYSLTRSAVVSLTSGTITGGTLAFTGANAAFANGHVSSVVTGTMGFTVTSGNTLSFAGLNTYTGKVAAQNGVLVAAIVSGSGQPSSLGAGTGANATIDLGNLATTGTFRYIGATSGTTNRTFNLSGTSGGGAIEASGAGPLVITSPVTATAVAKTLSLGGTSTAANTIGTISGAGVSVVKDGNGTWQLTAASSFTGQLTVKQGTILAGVGAGPSGSGVFGQAVSPSLLPQVGDSAAGASGFAAMLLEDGVVLNRSLQVAALGSGASQLAILGGANTSGTSTFASGQQIRIGRDVTLQAATGGTVMFGSVWMDSTGTGSPANSYTIGTAGNLGTVELLSVLATTSGSVSINYGTLSVALDNKIASTTPVSIGSTSGNATLMLGTNDSSLALSRLNFNGAGSFGGTVTNSGAGTLTMQDDSATATAALINVNSGTAHAINSAIAMANATTVSVANSAQIAISGAISGAFGLTKSGSGALTLSGSSLFSGATTVSAGTLLVNGSLASTAGLNVASGAFLGGSGSLASTIAGAGLVGPGNSPGILTALAVDPSAGTDFSFEMTGTGAPAWSVASASVNDVLHLTSTSPFTSTLNSSNAVNIYFQVASLAAGDTFQGGFFTDATLAQSNLLTNVSAGSFNYFVQGNGSGSNVYNGFNYYTLAEYLGLVPSITGVTMSTQTVASANFGTGTVTNGQVVEFVVVPEPDTIVFAGIGIAMAGWSIWKRRRIVQIMQAK